MDHSVKVLWVAIYLIEELKYEELVTRESRPTIKRDVFSNPDIIVKSAEISAIVSYFYLLYFLLKFTVCEILYNLFIAGSLYID